MGVDIVLSYVLKAAIFVLQNEDLVKSILSSDTLTDDEKARIRELRKAAKQKWDSLAPDDEPN